MTKRSLFVVLLLCLALLGVARPGLAQIARESGRGPLARMESEGWKAMQDGVLQRESNPGEIETFVYGVEGFTWKLRDLRAQLRKLRAELEANPTPELRRAIASHRKIITSTQEAIERARLAEAGGKVFTIWDGGCNLSFGLDVNASHKFNALGTWASASADFNLFGICEAWGGGGEVYAYAFAKTTVNGAPTTATVTDGPRSGENVSASADAHRNGGSTCESYAYSSVTSGNLSPFSYSKTKSSETCPAASSPATLQVSISSDADGYGIVVREERCVTVTWTVNFAGGTPFYTSNIYRNGVFQRTGTSYSEQFCFDQAHEQNYVEYVDIDVHAQVTDSGGQSRTVYSPTVTLQYLWWIY